MAERLTRNEQVRGSIPRVGFHFPPIIHACRGSPLEIRPAIGERRTLSKMDNFSALCEPTPIENGQHRAESSQQMLCGVD
jgi:hypothetical protein